MILLRLAWRGIRLAVHVLTGLALVLIWFPRIDAAKRWYWVCWWARRLLSICGVTLRVYGVLPPNAGRGAVLVANHISWLDIHLIHSLLPARFISKAEVRGWPVLGRLAEAGGTLFLERHRKADAARVNALMAEHLAAGDCLAFFPEGTTSDGRRLLPFYPSLFQPAAAAGATVWPVVIRYVDAHGQPDPTPAYHGDIRMGESMRRILAAKSIIAELHFLPPISAAGRKRRELAAEVEALMRAFWANAEQDMVPETSARPPDAAQ